MGRGGQPMPKPLPKALDRRQAIRDAQKADRAIKAEIRARDGYECRCCERGRAAMLEVHERKTRGAGGSVSNANSLTLCRVCHRLAQQYRIQIEGATCEGRLQFSMAQRIADAVFPSGSIPPHVQIIKDGV